jgi:hypothetical protein
MARRIVLVEIQVTSPTGEASTLRFCDRAIRPMPPTDGLRPNAGFDSRLKEPRLSGGSCSTTSPP